MGAAARVVTTMVLALALAACVSLMPAAYQPYESTFTGGYSETEVQPDLFLVRFMGNSATTPDRSTDFALLRGAEICLQRGKNFMRVGDLSTRYRQSGHFPATTSTAVTPTATPETPNSPPIVNTVETSPATYLYSPTSGIAVTCAATADQGAWDAQYLARAIRTKYDLT